MKNFFWVPMANYFGKRPVFVFASLLLCVCYIWGANAQSFESLLWSNIVAAFAGSSTEALGAAIVNVSGSIISGYPIDIRVDAETATRICTFYTNEVRKWVSI